MASKFYDKPLTGGQPDFRKVSIIFESLRWSTGDERMTFEQAGPNRGKVTAAAQHVLALA